jgi:hypothetical protein
MGLNSQPATPPAVPKKKRKPVGCINALVVAGVFAIPALTIIDAGLFPVISKAMLHANATAVGRRGREIYIGIVTANTGREPLGEGLVWPKTPLPDGAANEKIDLFTKGFMTSTEYFKTLADEENYGTDKWSPYISGFDYAKLAGAGVPVCKDYHLTAANNMWSIAANLTDADNDVIPILITRNVDVKEIERVINKGFTAADFNTRINVGSGEYTAPFGSQMVVVIRKGGGVFMFRSRQATLGNVFGRQEFPPRDSSKPKIVYLMP